MLFKQHLPCFRTAGIGHDALAHRAKLPALGLVKEARALRAAAAADAKDAVVLHMASLGHSGRQTPQEMHSSVIISAIIYSFLSAHASISASSTSGVTKRAASFGESCAISLTKVPLTNWY